MSKVTDVSTHINALELTQYADGLTADATAQAQNRYLAVDGAELEFWNGSVWQTVSTTSLDAGPKVAVVNFTSAQVKALRGTPGTLVAAPGAGKAIVVDSVTLQLNYGGTNAFTESTDNLVVQYGDSGTDITASIETTGFIDQTSDQLAVYYPADIATMATATAGVNEEVQLFNTGDGEIGGNAAGDNTLNVTVAYHIVTMV